MQNSQPKTESIFDDSEQKKIDDQLNKWQKCCISILPDPRAGRKHPGEGVGDGNAVRDKVRFYFPVLSVSTLQNSTEEN